MRLYAGDWVLTIESTWKRSGGGALNKVSRALAGKSAHKCERDLGHASALMGRPVRRLVGSWMG